MRVLAIIVLLAACTPTTVRPTPTPQASEPFRAGAPCAPALRPLKTSTAELTLLPHNVAANVVFGLDGAFVSTSSGYPLGAYRHWVSLDANGGLVRAFEWLEGARVLPSPDGKRIAHIGRDLRNGDSALYIRDTAGGPSRLASVNGHPPVAWLDGDRLLMEDPALNTFSVLDTRTLVDTVVFSPPPPPSPAASDEGDAFALSADLRWAILTRFRTPEGLTVATYLWDIAAQRYVGTPMPNGASLSPVGDLIAWVESGELRAMHLCDRRTVTLAALGEGQPSTVSWSDDGRFLSLSYGWTDEATAPRRVVVADLAREAIADVPASWGFIKSWSPGDDVAVLWRYGFHDPGARLARVRID